MKGYLMEFSRKILIVENEQMSAKYLSAILQERGHTILEIANRGSHAIEIAQRENPALVLIDILLEGQMSGIETAIQISHCSPESKIIYLSSFTTEEITDAVYESRAYAYLLKPCRKEEILVTVELALLQNKKKRESEIINLKNGYHFNKKLHTLCRGNSEISLSRNGHKFMEILVKSRGCTVSNEQICGYIWNEDKGSNALRALVYRIREKIDNHLIKNVKGMGYIIYS